MSVDLRTSVIILESNDKKIPYYSKAIISWSVCAITGEYGIDFFINYAITYIFALGSNLTPEAEERYNAWISEQYILLHPRLQHMLENQEWWGLGHHNL